MRENLRRIWGNDENRSESMDASGRRRRVPVRKNKKTKKQKIEIKPDFKKIENGSGVKSALRRPLGPA